MDIKNIIDFICVKYNVTEEELKGTRKTRNIFKARATAMWLIYENTQMS